ncbi:MAG: lipoprotein insertase outer membrane protein LolB [Limnohabitans sp.]
MNFTASFELTGSPESGELNVLSPFGHHLARLQWSRQRAQLQRGKDLLTRPSLDALVYELTGTELPLPALFQWLAGQPADAPVGKSTWPNTPKAGFLHSAWRLRP